MYELHSCFQDSQMAQIPAEPDADEIRRLCSLLEGIANRPDLTPDEVQALETAAVSLMAVHSGLAIQRAYMKLAAAYQGEIPEHVKDDMRAHGMDIDALETDGDFEA